MKLEFCPTCGLPTQKLDNTHYRCEAGHDYYNNPRAAVVIILLNKNNELLYSKRAHDPMKDKFDLPGGFVEFGENATEALLRESQEELGITPTDAKLITTVSNHYIENVTTVDCIYLCHAWEGELLPADDVISVEWHPLEFMQSDQFAWPEAYKPLYEMLQEQLLTL